MATTQATAKLILKHAGKLGFEGVVSKTIDAPYAPGNRGLWRKAKALNRQEFAVVGQEGEAGMRREQGADALSELAPAAQAVQRIVFGRHRSKHLRDPGERGRAGCDEEELSSIDHD